MWTQRLHRFASWSDSAIRVRNTTGPGTTSGSRWSIHWPAEWGITWEHSKSWRAVWAKGEKAILVKPTTYMNRSGEALQAVSNFYKIEPAEILVVLDDLALELGRLRLRTEGGTGGHNGLESIIVQLGDGGNSSPSRRDRSCASARERSTMFSVASSKKSGQL